jgi:hypothetical protein
LSLACDGLGEQCFTRTRRADEQCALGDLRAEVGVFFRCLQEVHDLLQFLFGFVQTGHIVEGDVGALAALEDLCAALADVEDLPAGPAGAAHAAHHEHPDQCDGADEQQPLQDLLAHVVLRLYAHVHLLRSRFLNHLLLHLRRVADVEGVLCSAGFRFAGGELFLVLFLADAVFFNGHQHGIAVHHDALHIALGEVTVVVRDVDAHEVAVEIEQPHGEDHHHDHAVDPVKVEGALRGRRHLVLLEFGFLVLHDVVKLRSRKCF